MQEQSVVFYDGVCNFCNGAVRFVIQRDKKKQFLFASLQGEYAEKILGTEFGSNPGTESIKLLENGKIYERSSAVLRIVRRLSGAWPMLFALYIIPPFIRDFFYKLVAANRYRIWGKSEDCQIPDEQTKARFL